MERVDLNPFWKAPAHDYPHVVLHEEHLYAIAGYVMSERLYAAMNLDPGGNCAFGSTWARHAFRVRHANTCFGAPVSFLCAAGARG